MVQTLLASNIDLGVLIRQFGLQLVTDEDFFPEWQAALPDISADEKQYLDRVKDGYFNLVTNPPLLEKPVQIAILAPILFLGGFYLPPFQIRTEESIAITAVDEDTIIRGQLDILLLKEQFWVMAIESKQFAFSVEAGLAQLLAYMLANPHPERPGFGLIVTGGTFAFIKLVKGVIPQYAISDQFAIRNRGNDLYTVLRILKRIGSL